MRILIVEDEAIVSMDLARRLAHMGYEVAGTARTGEEAVTEARRLEPDLILMDIMLGGKIDGIDAATRIRESLHVPLVYLTAYADEKTLARARITDPFGYVIKPFEDKELGVTIEMARYKFRMDMKLHESERWLATTLRSIGDAVLTTDKKGRVRFANPEAERLLGAQADELLGRDLEEVFVLSDTGGSPVRGLVPGALKKGEVAHSGRLYCLPAPGGSIPVHLNISPIRDGGRKLGTVLVFRDVTERLTAEESLRQSVQRLQTMLQETVNALAVTGEKRDPYTAGHQQRVADLACLMAERMGLDGSACEGLRVAGLLHDLGKIYVPAEILSKPSQLTDMEMGLVRTHAEAGFDILREIPFPWPVAEVVLQHHERLDGSGYPRGLAAGAILPEARVLAVADVVEAMSSHRPYRAALGVEQALFEIEKNSGRLYDPEAVTACLSLFRSGYAFPAPGVGPGYSYGRGNNGLKDGRSN